MSDSIGIAIELYKKHHKEILGEYLYNGGILLNLIMNNAKDDPIKMKKLEENTDKSPEELNDIFDEVDEYLFNVSGNF